MDRNTWVNEYEKVLPSYTPSTTNWNDLSPIASSAILPIQNYNQRKSVAEKAYSTIPRRTSPSMYGSNHVQTTRRLTSTPSRRTYIAHRVPARQIASIVNVWEN